LHEHRQRLNFLFIGPRLTAFIEIHSLNMVFFWYFLSSSGYRAEKQTRQKALAAYLPLSHSYG